MADKNIFAMLREERTKAINEEVETPAEQELPEEETTCPECGSTDVTVANEADGIHRCGNCGHVWVAKASEEDEVPTEEPKEEPKVDEGDETPEEPEVPAEEPKVDEEDGEEVKATFCPEHGLVSGVGDAQVTACPICGEPGLIIKTVKVVGEDGVVEACGKRVPLTESQKAALVKARGIKEEADKDDEGKVTCPECGFVGAAEDFLTDEEGCYCPECGANVNCDTNESVADKKLKAMLESVGAPAAIHGALKSGKRDLVKRYLSRKVRGM